jgi:hypothetical protein
MTGRPHFSESRRRPVCIAVALSIVLVAVVLAAGCSGDCPKTLHTVIITKLDTNGNITWTKSLDTGISNTVSGMVPTSDGGFVTAGSIATSHSYCTLNSQARLIRYTSTGEVLWDRVFTGGERGVWKIIRTHDGGFAALIDGSKIYRLDYEGRTLWNRSTGYVSLYGSRIVIGETFDGGLVVAGPLFVRYDPDGNIIWNRSVINEADWGFLSINEIEGGHKYLIFSSEKNNEIREIKFNGEGKFINSSVIITEGELTDFQLYDVPDGYRLLYSDNKLGTMIMNLDPEGIMIDKQKINVSFPLTLTEDKGYFYAEIMDFLIEPIKLNPDGTVNKSAPQHRRYQIQAVKLDQDGTRSWNSTIPNPYLNTHSSLRIIQAIQTTDGGFIIASDNEVQKDVSTLK